ncbi:hypothetical protein GCM10020256_47710 [Streptomyces thermocoprophilus]
MTAPASAHDPHDPAIARSLDVSFGRYAGLDRALRSGLAHQPVRYEPMAVVLPEDHRPASRRCRSPR